jgi:hypothetical protein
MTRTEQTARLANDLACQMERGVRNPDQRWIFATWLRRFNWNRWGYTSDITDYDLTLVHQMEYALANVSAADLRRQAAELLAAQ